MQTSYETPLPLGKIMSKSDERCMMVALYYEARGEGLRGIKAVEDVIRNRAAIRKKSVCSVLREPNQFSWYKPGMIFHIDDGKFLTTFNTVVMMPSVVSGDVEYFHSGEAPVWTKKMQRVAVVGNHKFYKEK